MLFIGTCLRCRKESPSIFLHMKQKSIGYCLNICVECIITTVPQCTDKRSIYTMGDYIWDCHIDTPKNTYIDLEYHASHRNREAKVLQRAREAKFHVRTAAKFRRNTDRELIVRQKAAQCKIDYGFLISWGFDTVAYDEYYGEINEVTNEPNGNGVRFYADGSIYIGNI